MGRRTRNMGGARNSVEERIENAVSQTKPGSIIIMHVMHGDDKSMQAVRPIVRQLKEKGYTFLTISELMAL